MIAIFASSPLMLTPGCGPSLLGGNLVGPPRVENYHVPIAVAVTRLNGFRLLSARGSVLHDIFGFSDYLLTAVRLTCVGLLNALLGYFSIWFIFLDGRYTCCQMQIAIGR